LEATFLLCFYFLEPKSNKKLFCLVRRFVFLLARKASADKQAAVLLMQHYGSSNIYSGNKHLEAACLPLSLEQDRKRNTNMYSSIGE